MRYDYAFHSGERAAVEEDAMAYWKIRSGYHRQPRFDDCEKRSHLHLIYGLWDPADADDVHYARHSQNWQTVGDIETAEQIAREKRKIDHLNAICAASPYAVKREAHRVPPGL